MGAVFVYCTSVSLVCVSVSSPIGGYAVKSHSFECVYVSVVLVEVGQ